MAKISDFAGAGLDLSAHKVSFLKFEFLFIKNIIKMRKCNKKKDKYKNHKNVNIKESGKKKVVNHNGAIII